MNAEDRPTAETAASVRSRLARLARKRGVEFQLLLAEYAIERFLHRLALSRHAKRYVLKGAFLFRLWSDQPGRATWDLDLLGRGPDGVEDVVAVVREICEAEDTGSIVFDVRSIRGEAIRPEDRYTGVRVRLVAHLGTARIPVQIDVGFGDAVIPPPVWERYPTLLGDPAPRILVYPRQAVVAEKLEAMISLGVTNSRMKDFYDVHMLAQHFSFEGESLGRAIQATFDRRGTPLPGNRPLVLTREFLAAPERATQWRAFLRRGRLSAEPDAGLLADALYAFLGPPLEALRNRTPFTGTWSPGGPWQ